MMIGFLQGTPMMDFFVREARAVVRGPMTIVRFGTCGTFRKEVAVGCEIVYIAVRSCLGLISC